MKWAVIAITLDKFGKIDYIYYNKNWHYQTQEQAKELADHLTQKNNRIKNVFERDNNTTYYAVEL